MANTAFMGGLGQGMAAAEEQEARSRALGVQEAGVGQDLINQASKQVDALADNMVSIIQNSKDRASVPQQTISTMVRTANDIISGLEGLPNGANTANAARQAVAAKLQAAKTQAEAAAEKGTSEATTARATAAAVAPIGASEEEVDELARTKVGLGQRDTALEGRQRILVESDLTRSAGELTPEQLASGIAGGRFVVSVNPQSGERQVLDLASGQVVSRETVAPDEGLDQTAAPSPPEGDVPSVDVSEAVGLGGKVRNAVNTLSDVFGGSDEAPFQPSLDAETALNALGTTTIALLQDAVPGRPNVFLLEKLNELTVEPNSILVGKARAKSRLSAIRGLLASEVDRVQTEVLDRPAEWKPEQLQGAKNSKSQLEGILTEYTRLLDAFGGGQNSSSRPSLESFEKR